MQRNQTEKKLTFRGNALFRSHTSKINNAFIDNAEDCDILKPMYNLIKYTDNYSVTSGNLWNYYRNEINSVNLLSIG